MKVLKKIILSALMCTVLLIPFASTASATDTVDPENVESILNYFNIDTNDPESIQRAIDEIKNGGLSGVFGILGFDTSDILNELSGYLGAMPEIQTTASAETTTEEVTTEEETTEEPEPETVIIEKPVYIPVTQKPVDNSKTESEDIQETTEATTEAETAEPATTENESDAAENNAADESQIPKTTIFVIASTITIFAIGLLTGIGVTRFLTGRPKQADED